MADAQINANDIEGAKYSFRRALAAGPGNPAILFRAASFYLRLEDYPETISRLTSILRNPDLSDYYFQVFSMYRQMDMPLSQMLSEGIPQNEGAATGFLSFWIENNQPDEAWDTWTWLTQNSLADLDAAAEYVSFLVGKGLYAKADDIWAGFNSKTEPNFLKSNWIFNGSFESEPADCPLDWNLHSSGEVTASIESGTNYGGHASLKVTPVVARKTDLHPADQEVILKPGSWTLRGYTKTNRTESDQLFFRIVDAENPNRLDVVTNQSSGAQEWTPVEATFVVPPETRLIRVELVIPKSATLVRENSGSIWVDHVELTPSH